AGVLHAGQVRQGLAKEDLDRPEFLLRGLPFLRWRIHCSGSSMTLQLSLSCAVSRFEGRAGGEGSSGGTMTSIIDALGSHTPSFRSRSLASEAPLVFS